MSVELESTSLTDSLTTALRKQIVASEIAPGEKLSEIWVANRFAVARPTAKAALDRLTNEGLLRRGPRRTAVVPQLSADDVSDLYFAREPIESRAVMTLANRREVPGDADRSLLLMRMAAEHDQHAEHTESDIALHRALVAATGSARLRRMHETVMGETQLCIAQVRAHAGLDLIALTDRHAAILEAIRNGDPDEAVAALLTDLHSCRDTLLADLKAAQTQASKLRA
ncbi:GntR family transcriptional regulator [Kribbella pratensis]|uniref:DNA-binding GntR family transcriptional regulator n=1 Tax=Kribbella pratensis TaxID=2512112 RepID=A0A4R8C2N9_9ACTN|nr:GntR family transcriptional regulator [Kribbella pratensis]TDW69335.1 DNA-binding GntR family transcriptional regulator [Kribbella pratensis]